MPAVGGSSLGGGTFSTATPMNLSSEMGWRVDQSDASIGYESQAQAHSSDQIAL